MGVKKEPNYRRALVLLTNTISKFENKIDKIMVAPDTFERDRRIAQAVNELSWAKQYAQFITLNYPFHKKTKWPQSSSTEAIFTATT